MGYTIDILLATYNGEQYLGEQLESLLHQSLQNWQLLIHDDNSTDCTVDIIREYAKRYPSKIKFIEDSISFGSASGNFGFLLEHSEAEYIMFCDQDDIWLPYKIEHSLNEMRQLETQYGNVPLLVFSDLKVVDENLSIRSNSMWLSQKLNPDTVHDLYSELALNVVTGCTVMINQAAKKCIAPIPSHAMMHDHWIASNIAKYGHASYIPEPLVLYRQHGANVIGAQMSGLLYFFNKSCQFIKNIKAFPEKYAHFNFEIKLWKVLYMKVMLNLQRLFR